MLEHVRSVYMQTGRISCGDVGAYERPLRLLCRAAFEQ